MIQTKQILPDNTSLNKIRIKEQRQQNAPQFKES